MDKVIVVAVAALLGTPAFGQISPTSGREPASSLPCSLGGTESCIEAHALAARTSSDLALNLAFAEDASTASSYAPVMAHLGDTTFTGVGGPVEERTGYPPCKPGPDDDECIQAYEPGVTGLGN